MLGSSPFSQNRSVRLCVAQSHDRTERQSPPWTAGPGTAPRQRPANPLGLPTVTVEINVQDTPNPDARRFVLDKPVQEQPRGRFFTDADSTDDALAKRLLELDGVAGAMLLPTSVTLNKDGDASWDDVEPAARAALEAYFA